MIIHAINIRLVQYIFTPGYRQTGRLFQGYATIQRLSNFISEEFAREKWYLRKPCEIYFTYDEVQRAFRNCV